LNWLPPGFAANAILLLGRTWLGVLEFLGLLASTALFASAFAIRLHKQFLGEYLSEGSSRTAPARIARSQPAVGRVGEIPGPLHRQRRTFAPVIGACLRKEWLMLRGNSSQLLALLTPLVFIVILDRTTFAQHPAYFLPGAIAYALVGVLAGLYNIFGADGLGVQVYLLAPARLRDVIVAKNLAGLAVVLAEAGAAWILVSVLSHGRIPLATQVATGLWTCFVIAVNLALGTLRSIQAPHRFVPGQPRQRRGTPTGRTSGLLIFVVLFGSLALQLPVVMLCRYLHEPWLAAIIFGPFAVAAFSAYAAVLLNAEKLVLDHRDVLAEVLCRA
jgi:ABC-2 type transport system permease protein